MMFKQVKDILAVIQNLHDEVISYYENLEDKTDKERIKQLLEYLKKKKNLFRSQIEHYKKEGYPPVLETWIQFTPEKKLEKKVQDLHVEEDLTVDEVINIAIHLDNWLEDILKYLVEKTPSNKVKEVFSSLLEVMKHEKQQMSTNEILMRDL